MKRPPIEDYRTKHNSFGGYIYCETDNGGYVLSESELNEILGYIHDLESEVKETHELLNKTRSFMCDHQYCSGNSDPEEADELVKLQADIDAVLKIGG